MLWYFLKNAYLSKEELWAVLPDVFNDTKVHKKLFEESYKFHACLFNRR